MSVTDSSDPADSADSEAAAASPAVVEMGCVPVGAEVEVGFPEAKGMAVDSVASKEDHLITICSRG